MLFVCLTATNIFNYLFQIMMGRLLAVEIYGIMNTLFSFYAIMILPVSVLILIITKYVVEYNAEGKAFWTLFIFFMKIGIGLCLSVTLVLFALSTVILNILKVESLEALWMTIVIIGITYIYPVFSGFLQGLKQFTVHGVIAFLVSGTKLTIGLILVYIGWSLWGALIGLFISVIIFLMLNLLAIKKFRIFKNKDNLSIDKKGIFQYGMTAGLVSVYIGIFSNADIILIQYYFLSYDAGLYSAVATIGKILLYLPNAIFTVLFPVITEAVSLGKNPFPVFIKGFLASSFVLSFALLIVNLFPIFFISTLLGEKYLEATQYVLPTSILTFCIGLLSLNMIYALAVNDAKILQWLLLLGIIASMIMVWIFHATVFQVILSITIVIVFIIILNMLYISFKYLYKIK